MVAGADLLQRLGQRRAGGVADRGVVEAGRAGGGRRATAALERVQPEVVVIAPGGQERQLIADAAGDREAEDVAVEADGALEVGHLEMDVADLGAGIDRRVHAPNDRASRRARHWGHPPNLKGPGPFRLCRWSDSRSARAKSPR